jgi:hypothetical protein
MEVFLFFQTDKEIVFTSGQVLTVFQGIEQFF